MQAIKEKPVGFAERVGFGYEGFHPVEEVEVTVELQPSSKDVTLYQDIPDIVDGSNTYLGLKNGVADAWRNVISFDISSISGTVSSAILGLWYRMHSWVPSPEGLTVWAYKCTEPDWVEAEAGWNNYKSGTPWITAGGDYVTSNPTGGSVVLPAGTMTWQWIEIDVTAIVQDAIDSGVDAHILIKFEDETEAVLTKYGLIRSKEAADTTIRPKLTVTYTP